MLFSIQIIDNNHFNLTVALLKFWWFKIKIIYCELYILFKMISRNIMLLLLLTVNAYSVTLMTFDEFIVKYNKNYTQGSEEYNQKKKIFDFNV